MTSLFSLQEQKMDDKSSKRDESQFASLPDLSKLKKDFSLSISSFVTASSHNTLGREAADLLNHAENCTATMNGDSVTNHNSINGVNSCDYQTSFELWQGKAEVPLQNSENEDSQVCNKVPGKYINESQNGVQNLQVLCAAALLRKARNVSDENGVENEFLYINANSKESKNETPIQNIKEIVDLNEQEVVEISSEKVAGFSMSDRVEDSYFSCSSSWGSMNLQHLIEKPETKEEEQEEEEEIDPQLPSYLHEMLKGMTVIGDRLNVEHSSTVFPEPHWLNHEKFRRGQEIALRYHFGLVFAEVLSLLMLFSFPDALSPLVFTGKSDTPFKAFRRYLSTVTRVKSWYEHNPWKPDSKAAYNLCAVRKMHENVRNQLHEASALELIRKLSVATSSPMGCPCAPVWSPLNEKLHDDFQTACPYPRPGQTPYLDTRRKRVFISQWEMVGTQFGFVSLFVMFPKHFGAYGVTDDELECFIHTWRAIGYMLGIEDCYNFCNGSLETVRQRCADFFNFFVKANFRVVSRDWEHMSRCVMEGVSYYVPKVSFEVSLLYLCNILKINVPRLKASLTFRQKYDYCVIYFVYHYLCRIPGMLRLLNWLLDLAIKRAQNFSLERLTRLERKLYPYQTT